MYGNGIEISSGNATENLNALEIWNLLHTDMNGLWIMKNMLKKMAEYP